MGRELTEGAVLGKVLVDRDEAFARVALVGAKAEACVVGHLRLPGRPALDELFWPSSKNCKYGVGTSGLRCSPSQQDRRGRR